MEFKKQKINNDCINTVGSDTIEATCQIDTAARGGAKQLLTVTADATATQVETVEGQARVEGRVNYKILYLDGEDHVNGLEYYCDWQALIEDERIDPSRATATAYVADDKAALNGDIIDLTAQVSVDVWQTISSSFEGIVDGECECKTKEIEVGRIVPLPEVRFDLSDEIETNETVDRVLYFDARAVVDEIKQATMGSTVEGTLYADVVYLSGGELRSKQLPIPFAEEIEQDGDIAAEVAVKSARVVVSGEENNGVIRVETVLTLSAYRNESESVTVVEEMFAEGYDLEYDHARMVCKRPHSHYTLRHKIGIQTPIGEETGNISRIITALPCRLGLANLVAGTDQITVEGLAVVSVVGEGEGMVSATVEIPFSVTAPAKGVSEDCLLDGTATLCGVEATIKGGMLDVSVTLVARVNGYLPVIVDYIPQAQAVEAQDEGDAPAISVYFPQAGESLWDVAREVKVSPAKLQALNPDWEEEPRRVIVFRHKEM